MINVLLSSDDNYAQHMGVALYSLLSTVKDEEKVVLWIVDNGIKEENRLKLHDLVSEYSFAKIQWIDFEQWKDKLSLNMTWKISISAYSRLFVASMLPEGVNRVLYIDSDVVVRQSVSELWNMDLNNNIIGAVQDDVSDGVKSTIGLNCNDRYFNSGMLLVDLDRWRAERIEEKCMKFIAEHNGCVIHHDQGVLNGVLKGMWMRLPLQYNLMTVHYIYDRRKILKYYGEHADFYTEEEIEEAKSNPVILHFTPSFTSRPWVKTCVHPLKNCYWESLGHTPWKDAVPEDDKSRWAVRMANWYYRNIPF